MREYCLLEERPAAGEKCDCCTKKRDAAYVATNKSGTKIFLCEECYALIWRAC